ncbi:MAG: hypothetical protein ACI94D_002757, partial [Neolewinella sp.]
FWTRTGFILFAFLRDVNKINHASCSAPFDRWLR